MHSRSFGLVFVMGSLFDKLRMYLEKLNQSEGEDSKTGVKMTGMYSFVVIKFLVFRQSL